MTGEVAPVRVGRHVTIRPLRPMDYDMLYEIAMFTDAGSRWRLHGDMPPHDRFIQILLRDARVTFAIESNETRQVLGMVQLWSLDTLSRNGHITAFLHPAVRGRGWPLEGVLLFLAYVFPAYNLHKLYFESLGSELAQYGSMIGTFLRQEARLREHRWVFGRLEDSYVLALYQEDAARLIDLLAQPLGARPAPVQPADDDMPVIEVG